MDGSIQSTPATNSPSIEETTKGLGEPQTIVPETEKEEENILDELNPKHQYFIELYLDKDNTHGFRTFGNATQSAIHAFHLDPVKQKAYASSLGSDIVRKSKVIARKYLESKGLNYTKMLDIAMNKMVQSGKPDWWDRIMEHGNMAKEKIDPKQAGNTYNFQQNNYSLAGEEVKDFNEQFKKFLEAQ